MFKIQSVKITGFWGRYEAFAEFNEDVTVFIGRNGTGKTTFINLLEAVLRADVRMLSSIEFSTITLKLKEKGRVRTVKVERIDEDENEQVRIFSRFPHFVFTIAKRTFRIPVISPDYPHRVVGSPSFRREYESLREEIDGLINIASLSVHRADKDGSSDPFERAERIERNKNFFSPIDTRLHSLLQKLTSYQLTLSEQASRVSSDLQKDVLLSMLYDKEMDTFRSDDLENVNSEDQKKDLIKAYADLSAFDNTARNRINAHFDALNKSIQTLKSDTAIAVDDIMPLPLLRRTQRVIELARKAEERKKEIFRPIRQFEEIVREFMVDKEIQIISSGDLQIKKEKKVISIADLSSGEKQLLILLTETLLQRNETFIFLADEPEISLHIAWQAQIVSSIKRLNQNAQIVVATHSPEVAGGWQERIVDMEDIVHD